MLFRAFNNRVKGCKVHMKDFNIRMIRQRDGNDCYETTMVPMVCVHPATFPELLGQRRASHYISICTLILASIHNCCNKETPRATPCISRINACYFVSCTDNAFLYTVCARDASRFRRFYLSY